MVRRVGVLSEKRRLMKTLGVPTLLVLLSWGAPAGASPRDDWSKATTAFQAALGTGKDADVEQAAAKVAGDNSVRAVDLLLKHLRTNPQPGTYWAILSGLSRITDAKALDAIATEVLKGKTPELRRDLIMALRLSEAASAVEPLTRILKEGTPELQVSAMDELVDRGVLGPIPLLIEIAEKDPKEERELTRRCFKAIRALTKEEPPGGPATWKAWWEKKSGDVKPDADAGTVKRGVGETVVESIRRSRATEVEDLKKAKREDVLVIQGVYDKVEDVLTTLGVPHTVVTFDTIRPATFAFSDYLAVFVNCGSGGWATAQCERLRKYVEAGGYVFITDLGSVTIVKHAFPGYIDNGKGTFQNLTVDILPWKGTSGHPLLRGVDLPVANKGSEISDRLRWKIDDQGASMDFDPKRTIPLIEAPELASKKRPTAVAVTFAAGSDAKLAQEGVANGGVYEELARMGGGRVVCVLSHFSKQRTSEDGFALQNLLLNFLIEAKDRSAMREGKKGDKKPGKPEKKP